MTTRTGDLRRTVRVRRYAVLVAACAAAAWLGAASPARALPLASEPGGPKSAAAAAENSAAPGISVWSFVHSGSPERDDVAAEPTRARTEPAPAEEARWVAAPSAGDPADDALDQADPDGLRQSAPGTTLLRHRAHRSVRHSSGGPRTSRPESEETVAAHAYATDLSPPPIARSAWGGDDPNPNPPFASRLFRPPRAESRLP